MINRSYTSVIDSTTPNTSEEVDDDEDDDDDDDVQLRRSMPRGRGKMKTSECA